MTTFPDLRLALLHHTPGHPLVEALAPGPSMSFGLPAEQQWRSCGDAFESVAAVVGPGDVDGWVLDLGIDLDDVIIWTMGGGRFESTFPPRAFSITPTIIAPGTPVPPSRGGGYDVTFGSRQGRSSDAEMPFLLIEHPELEAGLWIAIGSSGRWSATIRKHAERPFHRLTVRVPGCGARLGPQQKLVLPRVIVGTYVGDGWAAIRSFLHDHAPRLHPLPILWCSWFSEDADIDEARCLDNIAVAAEIGVDVFQVDAGWYADAGANFAGPGLGTWDVDPLKFPRGLEFVSTRAREAGMKFALWFEPERAHASSRVAIELPHAMRSAPDTPHLLVDFGYPEAREWMVERIAVAVERWSVDWIKWDMNVDEPAAHFGADELGELAHMRGVWAAKDELRRRFPTLHIEACASGGNRLDVEILARSHSCALSDQTSTPDIVRQHLAGACRILPAQFRQTGLAVQVELSPDGTVVPAAPGPGYPAAAYITPMAGSYVVHDKLRLWPATKRAEAAAWIARYRQIRHLLDRDLTLLSSRPSAGSNNPLHQWIAWEFADRVSGEAVLMAFRQRSAMPRVHFAGFYAWDVELDEGGADLIYRAPD